MSKASATSSGNSTKKATATKPQKVASKAEKAKGPISLSELRANVQTNKPTHRRRASSRSTEEKMAAPVRSQGGRRKVKPTSRQKLVAKINEEEALARLQKEQKPLEPYFKPPKPGDPPRFSDADLEEFRQELLYIKERISSKMIGTINSSFKREDESHCVEDSAEAIERFFAAEVCGSYNQTLCMVDDALAAIANGTYGICENCHGLIQKPRLQALPFAKNCIRCQKLIESGQL